jgi:hypothetical protein
MPKLQTFSMETAGMKIFAALMIVAAVASASPASAYLHRQPIRHIHRVVCHYHQHKRICR